MDERDRVAEAAERIAAAIARRDLAAIRELLAPGFVHRTHGGASVDAEAFMRAIEQIPGEILLVRLEQLEVDMAVSGALVTGVQHAQVRVDDQVVDDRRGFVDWFVTHAGEWRVQAAVDLPIPT
jgi:uncharacterized protein DUF4440